MPPGRPPPGRVVGLLAPDFMMTNNESCCGFCRPKLTPICAKPAGHVRSENRAGWAGHPVWVFELVGWVREPALIGSPKPAPAGEPEKTAPPPIDALSRIWVVDECCQLGVELGKGIGSYVQASAGLLGKDANRLGHICITYLGTCSFGGGNKGVGVTFSVAGKIVLSYRLYTFRLKKAGRASRRLPKLIAPPEQNVLPRGREGR